MSFKTSRKNKRNSAFTLVELVIVIAVIAVLSAILVPTFSNIIGNAKKAKTDSNLKVISTELVTQAYTLGVDYFTIENVKSIAKAKGFDLDGKDIYIPDGHSVWYDQATYNLKLVADAEAFASSDAQADTELAVYTPEALFGAGANGSVIANLPRRPEAVSSDKNKLLIASKNEALMDAIKKVYTLGDSENISDALIEVLGVFSSAGIPQAVWSAYQQDFSPETTLYVRTNGQLVPLKGGSNGSVVKNVVISKNASVIDGTFYGTDTVYQYNFNCAIEIPDNIEEVDETFNNVAYNGAQVVTQKPEVVKASNLNVTTVNTGSGLVDNSIKYNPINLNSGAYVVFEDTYETEYANGFVKTTTFTASENSTIEQQIEAYLEDETLLNEKHAVVAKYFKPRLQFNMQEIGKQLYKICTGEDATAETNVTDFIAINSVSFAERNYGDYRMTTILAIYTYTNSDGEQTVYGARLGNGFGYITTISTSTASSQTVTIAGEGETQENATGVALTVKLPSECLKFENYKNLKVEVEYTKNTTYYRGLKSVASNSIVYLKKVVNTDAQVYKATLTQQGTSSTFTASVDDFDMIGTYADNLDIGYFRNGATITKVTVTNGDGLVLYVQEF